MSLKVYNQKVGPGLGREDIGAPSRIADSEAAASAALTKAVTGSLKVVTQIHDTQQDEEARSAAIELKRKYDSLYSRLDTQEQYDLVESLLAP